MDTGAVLGCGDTEALALITRGSSRCSWSGVGAVGVARADVNAVDELLDKADTRGGRLDMGVTGENRAPEAEPVGAGMAVGRLGPAVGIELSPPY
jgi:hypothetical protein